MLISDMDNLRMSIPSADKLLKDRFIDRYGESPDELLKRYAASTPFYTSEKSENSTLKSCLGDSEYIRPIRYCSDYYFYTRDGEKLCKSCLQPYGYDKCTNPLCESNQGAKND